VATLLVLALSAVMLFVPASSAKQAPVVATAHEQVHGGPTLKDETPDNGTSSGDDDRWGSTDTSGTGSAPSTSTGTPPAPRVPAPAVSWSVSGVQVEVVVVPGFVIFLITPR
jgi:hypothetical protein